MKRIAAVVLLVLIAGFAFLLVVRGQFSAHLKEAYQDKTFSVGFVIADPIYGNYVSKATCLEDYTEFTVSKSWNTKRISDNYLESKNRNDYNAFINNVFFGKPIYKEIESVTGSGKDAFDGSGNLDQINFYLADEKEHVSDIGDILKILDSRNIVVERIYFTYEKEKHVYQLQLSADDYDLNEEEIQNRIEMIK